MSNPSTIWAQLSIPNPASGSIPFVDVDDQSIITDMLNFSYSSTALILTSANGLKKQYTTTVAIPGAATINKMAGRVKLAAGQTTLVISNNLITGTELVSLQMETLDATMLRVIPVVAAGSITITGNAACTAAVIVSFDVTSVY